MKKLWPMAVVAVSLVALAIGCASSDSKAPALMKSGQESGKGAAQLWSENCARCHNSRSPSSYSDAEWDVAVHHMRVRACLTAEEHKKIVEFLKAGN